MTFTSDQNAALNAPLDPKHVRKPSGSFGPKGDYLEGWFVINELNRVFGFDGWSYSIDLTRDALEKADGKDQWQAAYTCVCTLKVGDVTRQDVGFGSGFAKQIGDAIEGATKEAATDALKRAARTFGNIFGLALYDKSRANVQAAPEPVLDDAQYAELVTLSGQAEVDIGAFCKAVNIASLKALPAHQFEPIRKRWQDRLLKLANTQKEAANG